MKPTTTVFHVGDSDLYLLGVAAALAARYEARRKSGQMRGFGGFPQSDMDAINRLRAGIEAGAAIAPDDVPALHISVSAEKEVVYRLVDLARGVLDGNPDDNDVESGKPEE